MPSDLRLRVFRSCLQVEVEQRCWVELQSSRYFTQRDIVKRFRKSRKLRREHYICRSDKVQLIMQAPERLRTGAGRWVGPETVPDSGAESVDRVVWVEHTGNSSKEQELGVEMVAKAHHRQRKLISMDTVRVEASEVGPTMVCSVCDWWEIIEDLSLAEMTSLAEAHHCYGRQEPATGS